MKQLFSRERLVQTGRFVVAMSASLLTMIGGSFVSSSMASAAVCNFTGGSGNWGTSGNWSCAHVPIGGDDVLIGSGQSPNVNVNPSISTISVSGTVDIGNKTFVVTSTATIFSGGSLISGTNNGNLSLNTVNGNTTSTGTLGSNSGINSGVFVGGTLQNNGVFNVGAGTVTTTGAVTNVGTFNNQTGTLNILGDFTNNGTFNGNTGSTVFRGSSAQALNGTNSVTFNNLTINNSNGVTISKDTSVGGTLTFTSGNVTTNSNTLSVTSDNAVTRTSGHVVGNLKMHVATGAAVKTFTLGTGSNYTPIVVTFGNVTVAGNLSASTTASEHPNVVASGINASKDINRYYGLVNSGTTFNNFSAVYNWVAGDVDGGANTSNFIAAKYDGVSWTLPTVGTKTATSLQTTGVTTFTDVAIGEAQSVPTVSSINRTNSNPASSTSAVWTVTFSEAVTGVDLTDFSLSATGTATGTLLSVNAVSSTVYTVTANGVSGIGGLGLNLVDDDSIQGAVPLGGSGTGNGNFTGQSYSIDQVAPTVALTTGASNPTNVTPFTVTSTFSENVSGFMLSDIVVGNGSASAFTTSSNSVYTFQVTPSGNGTVTVDIPSSSAFDGAGNGNTAATQLSLVYDGTAPVISVTAPLVTSSSTISNTTIQVTDNNGIASSTVSLSGSTVGTSGFACVQTSATQVDCTLSITSGGTLTVNATDAAGNAATTVNVAGYMIETTAPVATITASTKTSSTTISNTTIKVTDNYAVSSTAVSVSGSATPTGLSCTQTSSTQVDCTVNITTSGTLTVDATDKAGNAATQASEAGYIIETTAPVISVTAPTKTSSSTISNTTIQVTDNNAIASSTVSVSGSATPTGLSCVQTSATQVDCTVNITASGTLTVNATDVAGNAATAANVTGYVIDTTAPVIAVTAPTHSSSTAITDTTIQVTDNNAVSSTAVSVSGSATPTGLSCVQTSATQVDCTVSITSSGTLLVDATDVAGNPATQASEAGYSIVETTPPVITITAPTKMASSTITNTTIKVTDNIAISSSTVSLSASTAGYSNLVCTQTSSTQVDCTVDITSSGNILVDATDVATNPATQTASNGYVIDTVAPVIAITAPTHSSTTSITDTTIQVTDNHAVSSTAVSVSGGAFPTNLVCTQTSATQVDCTVKVTASGTLLVDAHDAFGIPATQASEAGYSITDGVAPVIAITAPTKMASSTITNTTIRVTDNIGISSSTVSLSASTVSYSSLVCTQTSSTQVDCTVSITSSGDLAVDASDAASNPATQATVTGYVIDTTAPVITITPGTMTASSTITDTTIKVTDNRAVSSSSVTVTGTALPTGLNCTQTSSTQVDCTVDITHTGTLLVNAYDALRVPATQASQAGYLIDNSAPVITITAPTLVSSSTISNTTIRAVNTAITASNVTVSGMTTVGYSGFNCAQTSSTQVDCTIDITSDGRLVIDAMDDLGIPAHATKTGYLIDTTAPSTPVVSPAAGSFNSAQTITFSTNDGTATIRYTTDGTTPTCSTGNVYSSGFLLSSSATVKAIACDQAGNSSGVSSDSFGITIVNNGGGGLSTGGSGGSSLPSTAPTNQVAYGGRLYTQDEFTRLFGGLTTPPPSGSTNPTTGSGQQTGGYVDPSNLSSLVSGLLSSYGLTCSSTAQIATLVQGQVAADAKEFKLTLSTDQKSAIQNFIVCGMSPATVKFGRGERRAIMRDYMETVNRPDTVWSDVERISTGQIPLTRNLTIERQRVTVAQPVFRSIFGHDPNFKDAQENLAWNTLMYRIRFPRDVAKEAKGIQSYRKAFLKTPTTPFQWAIVRVLGYVL